MITYQILFYLALSGLALLSIVFLYYLKKNKVEIDTQQEKIAESNQVQNRLFSILGQEIRKPILTFRDISKKIDFLIKHKEFEALRQLGFQLDKDATDLNLMLENLLNWSKTQKGDCAYHPRPIPVKQNNSRVGRYLFPHRP